jgi:hypothetical protein
LFLSTGTNEEVNLISTQDLLFIKISSKRGQSVYFQSEKASIEYKRHCDQPQPDAENRIPGDKKIILN